MADTKISALSAASTLAGTETLPVVQAGATVKATVTQVLAGQRAATIGIAVDGGGSAITTGAKGEIAIPFACTITSWSIVSDQTGSIVFDIWKAAGAIPTVGGTITASAKPTLTTAGYATSSTLTGWTTSVAAGDVLKFNVDSITTCTRATLTLKVT